MIALLIAPLAAALASTPAQPAPMQRLAVIVGAQQGAAGRAPLRYSHRDASELAQVLRELGEFSHVVTLQDPAPEAVLEALDDQLSRAAAAPGDSLVLFYYSGHADERALYPAGKPLALSAVKSRLENRAASVRIGIIDACRGGAWTRAKGLTREPAFEVNIPLEIESEGSVLIASSSGLDDASETDLLQGSFFTHHLVAGLRGAADQSSDGVVSLNEAFAYARELTIRDTARIGSTPQRPSFHTRLHGRSDVALSRVASGPSIVEYRQLEGPTQVIHSRTGLIVLEVPAGTRDVKLAIPPGSYVVRRRLGRKVYAKEVAVVAGESLAFAETSLELEGRDGLVAKQFEEPPPVLMSTLPKGYGELKLALGLHYQDPESGTGPRVVGVTASEPRVIAPLVGTMRGLAIDFHLIAGLTDRLQWKVLTPAFAYRLGERGGTEWIPWGGVLGWGIAYSSAERLVASASVGGGLDGRQWLGSAQALNFSVGAQSSGLWTSQRAIPLNTWSAAATIGYSHSLGELLTINVGAGVKQHLVHEGRLPGQGGAPHGRAFSAGSVQTIGFRPLPLLQLHLDERFTIDGYAAMELQPESTSPGGISEWRLNESFMIGVTVDI